SSARSTVGSHENRTSAFGGGDSGVGGMSRIRLDIDRLVLRGFDLLEAKALSHALQSQLSQVLAKRGPRGEWARPHGTPILKLGSMPLEKGSAGAVKLGRQLARAVARGLKP